MPATRGRLPILQHTLNPEIHPAVVAEPPLLVVGILPLRIRDTAAHHPLIRDDDPSRLDQRSHGGTGRWGAGSNRKPADRLVVSGPPSTWTGYFCLPGLTFSASVDRRNLSGAQERLTGDSRSS